VEYRAAHKKSRLLLPWQTPDFSGQGMSKRPCCPGLLKTDRLD
jgi:hypothetical protein